MLDRILCLANSYKHEHRCVAGISLASKRWVRLIGNSVPGCLTLREASYADGRSIRLLDIFEVRLGAPCNSQSHPEDIHLAPHTLRFIERFDQSSQLDKLVEHVSKAPVVLQGHSDRVYRRLIENSPVRGSIELVKPDDLWWWIRDEKGRRKYRALFRIGSANRIRYDLAVTDPAWLDQLQLLSPGIYPDELLCGDKPCKTLLTVSLTECFEGFHYKIAAGVISAPGFVRTSAHIAPTVRTR